ncbi:hypothetical protein BDA99DRAFT_506282 [Phascolomyces articulosus]|uniref:Uncharacterized protein n=1 Tax=Phascolomyces articulosus TaxID=60185 RepID=A0AAD5PFA7_9FUNG|nr:hypothetical protein BDA99DRAFT_506282 [Phascolomyces articulosus]
MAEKKGDYVAVPTTDVPPPPPPPPPFPHPVPTQVIVQPCPNCVRKECRLKKGRRVFKIIFATILLAFTIFKVILPALLSVFSVEPITEEIIISTSPFDRPHGKGHLSVPKEDLVGFEYAMDNAEFIGGLNAAFGEQRCGANGRMNNEAVEIPRFAPECCNKHLMQPRGIEEKPHHGKHNDKHHRHHRHHRHHSKAHGQHHHNKNQFANEDKPLEVIQVMEQPAGCPCGPIPRHHGGRREHSMPPPPPQFCNPEDELESTTKVFTFSNEQFQRAALFVGSGFPDSGNIFFSKSGEAGSDIKVNVTLLHGSEHAVKTTTISAFDHDGEYTIEMKRHLPPPPHHGPAPPPQDGPVPPPHINSTALCAKYEIHVTFPADLNEFENFNLRVRDGHIDSCPSLKTINFSKFHAGVGRGYINFAALSAQEAKFGVLSGHVRGTYVIGEKLSASALRGSSDLSVIPTGESAKIAVTTLRGYAQLQLPADHFEGNFLVHTTHHGQPLVEAPNPTDVHIEKYRHNLKAGYYKTKDTGYKAFVHVKNGDSKLVFN